MRISTFTYSDKKRVAVELGNDPRGCGLLTTQLYPERAVRTFKPGKMMQCEPVVGLQRLYWLFRFKVGI